MLAPALPLPAVTVRGAVWGVRSAAQPVFTVHAVRGAKKPGSLIAS